MEPQVFLFYNAYHNLPLGGINQYPKSTKRDVVPFNCDILISISFCCLLKQRAQWGCMLFYLFLIINPCAYKILTFYIWELLVNIVMYSNIYKLHTALLFDNNFM